MHPVPLEHRIFKVAGVGCFVVGLLGLGLVMLVFTLGEGLIMNPEPTGPVGAGSVDELLDLYRDAHRRHRPASLHPAFLDLAYLRWAMMRGRYDGALNDLFAFDLVGLRVVPLPAPPANVPANQLLDAPVNDSLIYLRQQWSNSTSLSPLSSGCESKVYLRLRRPDGREFEVDGSIAIVRHNGRYLFRTERDILLEAATAARANRPSAYLAVPPGTSLRELQQLAKLEWPAAVRRVEELRRQADGNGNAR